MDKRVILAAAGSGKTSHIIDSLRSSGRSLIVTYTVNNYNNLRKCIASEYGCIPDHIRLYTYFAFLYSFCLRPFAADKMKLRGINWHAPPDSTRWIKRTNEHYYLDKNRRLYHCRMAAFPNSISIVPKIQRRLSTYFDSFFVDEVQDFAGHDFNFLCAISAADLRVLLIGDFYQHTYDTSRDGNTNRNLHKDAVGYMHKLKTHGFEIDVSSFVKSYRCSPTVCAFVNQNIGIEIESHRVDDTKVEYVDTEERADELFHRTDIVKLFYKLHETYPCFSDNWGTSKGIDSFDNVCVVLNDKTDEYYNKKKLKSLAPQTKNKLYVACTRPHSNLYLVPQKYYDKYKN